MVLQPLTSNPVSKTILLIMATLLLLACSQDQQQANITASDSQVEAVVNHISVRNQEIRQDIFVELEKRQIDYWINEDDSIGFPVADAKTVDQIWYEVIGAYAARN